MDKLPSLSRFHGPLFVQNPNLNTIPQNSSEPSSIVKTTCHQKSFQEFLSYARDFSKMEICEDYTRLVLQDFHHDVCCTRTRTDTSFRLTETPYYLLPEFLAEVFADSIQLICALGLPRSSPPPLRNKEALPTPLVKQFCPRGLFVITGRVGAFILIGGEDHSTCRPTPFTLNRKWFHPKPYPQHGSH